MELMSSIKVIKNRTLVLLLAIIVCSLRIQAQTTVHLDKIAEDLKLEKSEGTYPILTDTVFQVQDYTFYSIQTAMSSHHALYIFRGDTIMLISNFPHFFNQMPFRFETFQLTNGKLFLKTRWYGETVSYTSIDLLLLELTDNQINIAYQDVAYYWDKTANKLEKINSYSISKQAESMEIAKREGDKKETLEICKNENLKLKIKRLKKIKKQKLTYLK